MPLLDEETICLAKKLASHEKFSPAWIDYPAWAGALPDIQPMLARAEKYKTWAVEIRGKKVPPPRWLVEEWPDYQDEALNTPKLPKKKRPSSRFACTLDFPVPPQPDPTPRRWSKKRIPSHQEIVELAIRLDRCGQTPRAWFTYPVWASFPVERHLYMECIKLLKSQAERILRGLEAPPAWLLRQEPWRWIPQPPFRCKTHPAPSSLEQATRHRLVRNAPLGIAWTLAVCRLAVLCSRPPMPVLWRGPPTIRAGPEDAVPGLASGERLLCFTVGPFDRTAAQLPCVVSILFACGMLLAGPSSLSFE